MLVEEQRLGGGTPSNASKYQSVRPGRCRRPSESAVWCFRTSSAARRPCVVSTVSYATFFVSSPSQTVRVGHHPFVREVKLRSSSDSGDRFC